MIPVIAILFSVNDQESVEVGIGAILGAPFMLSTVAFFVTGISVLIFTKRRKTGIRMLVDTSILKRDIGFFIFVYSTGISSAFISNDNIRYFLAVLLILLYIIYIIVTVKRDNHSQSNVEHLYLNKYLNMRENTAGAIIQILLALSGIIFGAELFVRNIEVISTIFGISTMILSLIITPIVTELPEKFNSVIWIARKKDTLALGNITGAMVFQSCIPVAIGILATTWELDIKALISAILTIASASITYLWLKIEDRLTPFPLISGGAFYIFFIIVLIRIYF
jgi:cation:H+ antiporter